MKRIVFLFMCICTFIACSKDDLTPMDGSDPKDGTNLMDSMDMESVVKLEDVLSNWQVEIDYRTCSSIDVSFQFDIIGDSTAIGDFGIIITNEQSDYRDTLLNNYQLIQGDFFELLSEMRSRSELDPALIYDITPFVEISDSLFYGVSESHQIGNFSEINIEEVLNLSDYNLGYNYISEATSVRIGNKGYLIGGLIGNDPNPESQIVSNVFLQIDFDDNSITELDPLPIATKSMVSFVYDGVIYAGGGSVNIDSGPANSIYRYNQNSGWEIVGQYPDSGGMAGGYALVHGDYVYMGLGVDYSTTSQASNRFHRFDPRDNTWEQMNNTLIQAAGGVSFQIDNKLYISHGNGSSFAEYDVDNNQWSVLNGDGFLQDAVSFVRSGRGYAYSGGADKTGTSVYVYDPITDEWTETCIENSDFRTYEGVVFDDGMSNPVIGFGDNSSLFELKLP